MVASQINEKANKGPSQCRHGGSPTTGQEGAKVGTEEGDIFILPTEVFDSSGNETRWGARIGEAECERRGRFKTGEPT